MNADQDYFEINIDALPLNATLQQPVYDQSTRKMILSAKATISERIIDMLRARGIINALIHKMDIEGKFDPQQEQRRSAKAKESDEESIANRFRTSASMRLDAEIDAQPELKREVGAGKAFTQPRPIRDLHDWRGMLTESEHQHEDLVARVAMLQVRMAERNKVDLASLVKLIEEQALALCRQPELFSIMVRAPRDVPYPARQSVMVMRLSMAVAGTLGWSREEIQAVGMGALCHDAGMLRLDDRLYRKRTGLNWAERCDLHKHPIYSLDLVQSAGSDLPSAVRYIIYQAHERCNGRGYPRNRTAGKIHPAARLVGLVDAFAAACSHRPHRGPALPILALKELTTQMREHFWDPVMLRALVKSVCVYPLGSFTELSDGRLARVILTNESDPLRPTLEVWSDPAAIIHEPGEMISLADRAGLNITTPMFPPQLL